MRASFSRASWRGEGGVKQMFRLTLSVVDDATSTSDLVRAACALGAKSGTAYQARRQTQGRGRHGRYWQSPLGNLYMSFLLAPERDKAEWASLSLVLSVALAEALEAHIEPPIDEGRVQLKWPNDVLVDDKKIAGILLEVEGDAVIIGMGVNIKIAPEVADGWASTRLADMSAVKADEFRNTLIACLETAINTWQQQGFAPFHADWVKRAAFLHRRIQFEDTGRERLSGIFRGINEHGMMRLEGADGTTRTLTAGEVVGLRGARPVGDNHALSD